MTVLLQRTGRVDWSVDLRIMIKRKAMSLAQRIRTRREQAGMSLDELAAKARVSKTYLWELEKDESGEKKPSADVLLRIASALSTTIADLMGLPTVKVEDKAVELGP